MERLLERSDRPTAVVAINDYVAMGAIRHAVSRGVKVPGDVSITGFDDILPSEYFVPTLTSVNHSYSALAEAALTVLVDRIEGRPVADETLVDTRAIFRESSS